MHGSNWAGVVATIIIVGLIVYFKQIRRHRVSRSELIMPPLALTVFAVLSSGGMDRGRFSLAAVLFSVALGLLFGALSATTIRIERDDDNRSALASASTAYVLWLAAFLAVRLGSALLLRHTAWGPTLTATSTIMLALAAFFLMRGLGIKRRVVQLGLVVGAPRKGPNPV